MTKYERRRFFERLVQLRALYRLRGNDDSVAEMSIDEAIAYGERLMSETPALAEVLGADDSTPKKSTATSLARADSSPRGPSATWTEIVCQPRAPSGAGGERLLLLDDAVAVGRADLDHVAAGRRRPVGDPLDPGRVRDRRRQAGVAPDAVDGDLDPGDATVRRPGDPGDRAPAPPPRRRAACRSATGSGSGPPWPSRAGPSSRRTPRASSARAR